MALKNYGLLKGIASAMTLDDDDSPHIEIRIEALGTSYRIAVNVRSKQAPHDLLFDIQHSFAHPILSELKQLPAGITDIRRDRPHLALDYVRGGIVRREDMEIAPFQRSGPANDLRDLIEPLVETAIAEDHHISFYAFGEVWGPEPGKPDAYFGFLPGNGIHDIHMNQGSRGSFASSNGVNQDGALLIHFGETDTWTAIFLAFQSQDWSTNAQTGHPLKAKPEPDQAINPMTAALSILAALIDPSASPEDGEETVTVLNRTDIAIDLTGWTLADMSGRTEQLKGLLGAGETLRVRLTATPLGPRLSNKKGGIQLVAPDGTITDRVIYQKQDVAREGWTTVF
ncbi:DUF2278 family protein [Pannonibacter sp.]|uniref:DUF2278 family protein n=1 Tax=Pannonibacter sp. TaxID=1906786 RepID=UPI003F731120